MKNQTIKNTHFSYEERVKIETLLDENYGKREIARRLGRAPSSVKEEIARNSVKGKYTALKAQFKSYQRRWGAKRQGMKIAMNRILRDYVEEKLSLFWSPEGIAGRLKYIETNLPSIGKDAVYGYVKSAYGRNLEQFLWYKGKKKKAKKQSKDGQLKDRIFIDQRPKYVENRRFFGDWEADFIVSGKGGSGALLVFVERKSRYTLIFKLTDRKVVTINYVLYALLGAQLVVNSLTIDNDVCFRHHRQMSEIMKAPIYFCHPYHSWEKGTVEKMNQLIRRFIPKKTDISQVPEEKIRWVAGILNNRPLKCLGFYTPAEVAVHNTKLMTFIAKTTSEEYIYR